MITKKEMERVWSEEPVGWLKSHNKYFKGKKSYTLVARPYTKNYLDPVEVTVYAKSITDALKQSFKASDKVREQYPYEQYKDIAWTTDVKGEI